MRSQKHQRQIDKKKVHIKIKSHHLIHHKLRCRKKAKLMSSTRHVNVDVSHISVIRSKRWVLHL